jgi:hypothetical protein
MGSLVEELEKESLNPNVSISALLRKSLVVAKKLGIKEMQLWVEQELNGYAEGTEIPHYREIHGVLQARHPYYGWVPAIIPDAKITEALSKRKTGQPIKELESLLRSSQCSNLEIPLEPNIALKLLKGANLPIVPTLSVSGSELDGIIDAVRNIILNWVLKLEEMGIIGDGMSFSETEKEAATSVSFNIGPGSNIQIQHHSPGSSQSMQLSESNPERLRQFIEEMKEFLKQANLTSESESELKSELATIEIQLSSPKPKWTIVRESLKAVRNILEGAIGSTIATGLLQQLNSFF